MTSRNPHKETKQALGVVGVELLDVIPESGLAAAYPSTFGKGRRSRIAGGRQLVAILRCTSLRTMDSSCGETWAVAAREGQPKVVGKRPPLPERGFHSAPWLCPRGRAIGASFWRPCNSQHIGTGLGDRATAALSQALVGGRRSGVQRRGRPGSPIPEALAELYRTALVTDGVLPKNTDAAEKLSCGPRSISRYRRPALRLARKPAPN